MVISRVFVLLLSVLVFACVSQEEERSGTFDPGAEHIQIVLFHLEKRCASCNAVERETLTVLKKNYAEEMEKGEIQLIYLDFQDSEGKKAAKILRASGQTLFVVRGDSIADLTSDAFMFAEVNPERYRKALVDALEKLLD
jgi:hypothetical protein